MSAPTPFKNSSNFSLILDDDEVIIMQSFLLATKFSYYPRMEFMDNPLLNSIIEKINKYTHNLEKFDEYNKHKHIYAEIESLEFDEIRKEFHKNKSGIYEKDLNTIKSMMYPYLVSDVFIAKMMEDS